jgi:O-antigen/teichoic acid export membrane protein
MEVVPSTIKPKKGFWAANVAPVRAWSVWSKSTGELSRVLAGKFALVGANAVVMLLLAKRLDLQTYGLLVLTISGQLLISRLLMVGVDTGMVRLTAIPELRSRSAEVVMAGFAVMVCTSSLLLIVSIIALVLLPQMGIPRWAIAWTVVGSIGTAFVDYGYSFRLARQEYSLAALAQGGTGLWRLAITAAAASPFLVHPAVVFMGYHGTSLISGLLQMFLILGLSRMWPERSFIRRLLGYSFWQGKSNVIVIFTLYQGTFLLMLLQQPAATGVFGLALTLSLGFFAVYNGYSEYLLARIRSVEHLDGLSTFIRHSLLAALMLVLATVPIVLALIKFLPWFLGPQWFGEVPIFVCLSASMALLVLQSPLEAACHYILRPQLISLGWGTRAILIACAGFILAPKLGALGAAVAQLIGSALALVVLSLVVAWALRSAARNQTWARSTNPRTDQSSTAEG